MAVCTEIEREGRAQVTIRERSPSSQSCLYVLNSINVFENYIHLKDPDTHLLYTTVNDNHAFTLVKTISKYNSQVRLYHLGKTTTEMATKNKVRKRPSKLVLFEHQYYPSNA